MRSLFILVKDQLKNAFRTKKVILFLLLYLGAFLGSMWIFFEIQKEIALQFEQQNIGTFQREFMTRFALQALSAQAENSILLDFLLNVPVVHVILFLVSIIGTPLLILLLGYDKIAQEVYDGTIRYLVFRTSRLFIFLSKFISSILEIAFVTGMVTLTGIFWASIAFPDITLQKSFLFGLRFWSISLFFLSPFIAYSLMCSALFKKPFLALISSFVGWFALILLPIWVPYVSPYDGTYMQGLFYPMSYALLSSLLGYSLFSLLFLLIGYTVFSKRDL